MNTLLILYSYHHRNTEKIANVFGKVLDVEITTPQQVKIGEKNKYNLIGFDSGIYSGKHHKDLLELADNLPQVKNRKAFIFSTDGAPRGLIKYESSFEEKILENHALHREKLQSKGYEIIDEFNCRGFNKNKFLKFFWELIKTDRTLKT